MIPLLSSLGFGFRFIIAKGLPSFVQHSFRFHGVIQDTHVFQQKPKKLHFCPLM